MFLGPILHKKDQTFLSKLHAEHWQNIQQYSPVSTLFKNDKEFQLHLYDKLWENIVHKENRVWTFLAVYGAAIGIAIGTGIADKLRFETGAVLLLLTYWAVEILIDADWWSVRNRLMVRGIERRAYEATKGIIPSFYHSPNYSSEYIYSISLLIFAAIGVIVFALSIGMFEIDRELRSFWELFGLTVLYAVFVFGLVRCAHNREKRIADYYAIFKDLNDQEKEAEEKGVKALDDGHLEFHASRDRKTLSWRRYVFLVYPIITTMMGIRYYDINGKFLVIFGLAQVAVVGIFVYQWYRYYKGVEEGFSVRPKIQGDQSFANWNLFLLMAFVLSVAVPLSLASKELPFLVRRPGLPILITELRGQLGKLEIDLRALNDLERIQNLTKLEKTLAAVIQELTDVKNVQKELEDLRKQLKDLEVNPSKPTQGVQPPNAAPRPGEQNK